MTAAHLYWFRDDLRLETQRLAAALPAAEQAELARFQKPERQRSFAVSRLLLRTALAGRLAAAPADIRFRRDDRGRLLPENPLHGHFSLSHAADLVAVIVADAPCGVDIERVRELAFMKVAQRYFAPAEVEWLAGLAGQKQLPAFFRLWTLKEAAVKALGEGLANNMARLAFSIEGTTPRPLHDQPALQLHQEEHAGFVLAGVVAAAEPVAWSCQEAALTGLA